jgi:hypothetical protein
VTASDAPEDGDCSAGVNGTIRTTFDWEAVAPSTAVIKAVSIAVNAEPTAIEPLYGAIDPEALDRLLDRSSGTCQTDAGVSVSFTFAGCEVRVHSAGTVAVQPTA